MTLPGTRPYNPAVPIFPTETRMPTYDYECSACRNRFEMFTKVHDTAPKPCPKCGKRRSKRLIGAGAGAIFKGSGFYVTDSKGGGGSPGSAKTSDPAKPAKKSDK